MYAYAAMGNLRRPEKIWERRKGKWYLTRDYLNYLRGVTRLTEDERQTFRELGVHLTNNKIARIEDLHGTAAFIEGDRA